MVSIRFTQTSFGHVVRYCSITKDVDSFRRQHPKIIARPWYICERIKAFSSLFIVLPFFENTHTGPYSNHKQKAK